MRIALLVLTLATIAACANERPRAIADSSAESRADADPTTRFRAQIGRTWELTRLGDQDIPAPAVDTTRAPSRYPGAGSRPTIRFTGEPAPQAPDSTFSNAGGWSFCNGYGAGYIAGPGDALRFSGFHSTLVGCDGPDSLETRFFRALGATRRFALDSATLVLIADDGTRLTFVRPDSAKLSRERR